MSNSPFDIKHRYGTCYATWYARRKAKKLDGKYGLDGEDLAQELALHLLCQWPQYDPSKGKPTTFIQNVVDTKVCELIRDRCHPKRDYRCHRRLSTVGEAAEHGLLDGVRGQPEHSDRELVEMKLDCEIVLNGLPKDLQRTAELLQEMSPAAAARELGITEGAVWKRMTRLREYFERAGYGDA
jgi:DNA-directed RNA polymerase specialized sigma24 family protein